MHIPLLEMTAEDAAEHATKVFLDVSKLTRRILTLLMHRIVFRLPCRLSRENAKSILQPMIIQHQIRRLLSRP